MTQKRTLLKYGILSLALAAPLSACAFDSLTVIGDSLSDTGNNGRWTWDSGQNKLYDEQLAERYGLELSPSSNGGSNYAAGGATATPELNPQDNTADQVRQWLAKTGGKADHNGLYIHWVGGNDLAAAIARPAMAQQIAGNSATSAAAQVGLLLDAGAGLVVVPNVPDISATPMLLEAVITAVEAAIPDCAIAWVAASSNACFLSSLFGRATTRYPYVWKNMIESCPLSRRNGECQPLKSTLTAYLCFL